jgi:demethylmenaquinone methyltransferase / 2-methoxy-6-polyprenyl-1,4-benzoquinol methylase
MRFASWRGINTVTYGSDGRRARLAVWRPGGDARLSTNNNHMNQEMNQRTVGAAPAGARDRESSAQAVREMFTSIAPRYDLLNHVLSFNIDRLWWWRSAREFDAILKRPDARVLDICCGTGDMTFALRRRAGLGTAQILGADFSHAMLQRAAVKGRGTTLRPLQWIEADALRLPFPDAHFNLLTSAFGFRNLADYDAGLREIARVLAPGGECGILDFGEPGGLIGQCYRAYFKKVLPTIGTVISGVRGPYAYLPESVERFPAPDEMIGRMRQAGFHEASWTPYTFGVAGLYRGVKSV